MSQIQENVRQLLLQFVPASLINDITCYVFYDNHPRDEKNIDITLCTKMGDIREYFQRDLISSVNIQSRFRLTEIRILRNSQCDLFYLVVGGEDLTILSRREKLQVHHKLTHVSKYEITDPACTGQASLKITLMDSNIPVTHDDNFENFKCIDISSTWDSPLKKESEPIITNLMRKLIEAKYSVTCNEKTYHDFLNIHQAVAFSTYKKIHPNLDDSVFEGGLKKLAGALKIHTRKPWIKTCNKKIVIVHTVCNENETPLEDVHILLHGTTRQTMEYTTKIFENTSVPPFWCETKSQRLKPNTESAIAVVIDLAEIKNNVINKMEFNGVITYEMSKKECILPIDDIKLSSLDTMGEDFNVLCSDPMDGNLMLAVLASTKKTELVLRHISMECDINKSQDQYLSIDLFCKYLKMEQVFNAENIVIHRKSPYHVLNGVMIISNSERQHNSDQLEVTVHSRSSSQVLALIHHIHDAIPLPLVATTPTHKITAKNDMLSLCNEATSGDTQLVYNYTNYATSMLNRAGLVLEYLDKSMIQMNESKNPEVRNKVGTEIDLFALGKTNYSEFKEKMRKEAAIGVKMLDDHAVSVTLSEEMCVD